MPYLKLWHGHRHPDEQLDGWGEDGPTFGPFPFFYMTYGCEIKFGGDGYCLNLVKEFVYYDGMYYGDWSFCDQLDEGMRSGLVTFDPNKAVRPDCRPGNLQPCSSQNEGGVSDTGVHIMDPQVAWQDLLDAIHPAAVDGPWRFPSGNVCGQESCRWRFHRAATDAWLGMESNCGSRCVPIRSGPCETSAQ